MRKSDVRLDSVIGARQSWDAYRGLLTHMSDLAITCTWEITGASSGRTADLSQLLRDHLPNGLSSSPSYMR